MQNSQSEPQPLAHSAAEAGDPSLADLSEASERHDGWTGHRMAMFCALLADCGIVTDACTAVGMSTASAYQARRRNALFAAAWEEALKIARERLADALLARSLEGSVERYFRDGELVGEKRLIDNRLGIAVLKRLDKRAEQFSCEGRNPDALRQQRSRAGLAPRLRGGTETPDWDLMLSALRTGDPDMIAEALAQAKDHEVCEVSEVRNPPLQTSPAQTFSGADEPDPRCWWEEDEQCWMTDFPPPPDFAGYQKGRWGDEEYERECTPEEAKMLAAAADAELSEERSEDEAARDAWFAQLDAIAEPAPPPKKKKKAKSKAPV